MQLLSLVDLLASLRSVAHMYVPLRAVSSPGLVQALGTLRSHKVRALHAVPAWGAVLGVGNSPGGWCRRRGCAVLGSI